MAEQRLQQELAARLLAWYDVNRRSLPWRSPPGAGPDPYHVWLSEIMLQQTTVAAVRAYYEKFLALWPTVHELAAAPDDQVMQAWAGLGYYARARNLLACARAVVAEHDGRFPESEAGLRQLPGIGPYTAGAIAAIAFDKPQAAVDGNVERVISRMYAIATPLPDSKPEIRELAQSLVPGRRAGDFAQAMMDLGATICTPRKPACALCPWNESCEGRRQGIAETLPRKAAKAALPRRTGTVYWVERADGEVLLHRRPAKGMLGGMLGLPTTGWDKRSTEPNPPLIVAFAGTGRTVEHTFTHFHLTLAIERCVVPAATPEPDESYRWASQHSLEQAGLPSLFMKVVAAMRR
jgi:A/G-specific adenine glycosylase